MALSVMDEPQVGPTVVMLIMSACVAGTALLGAVVGVLVLAAVVLVLVDVVLVLVAVVLVVVGAAVVEVVLAELGGLFPVSLYMASCTFWLI